MAFNPHILWGALGGVLPHVVQNAQQLLGQSPDTTLQSIISIGYIVGLILLALIGAIIVATFQEKDNRKALFLGISAPALITAAASTPQEIPTQPSITAPTVEVIGSHLFHNAFADANELSQTAETLAATSTLQMRQSILQQSNADIGVIPRRYIEVYAVNGSATFDILFQDKDKKAVQLIELPEQGHGLLSVPPAATFIQFTNGSNQSDSYSLAENDQELQGYFVSVQGEKVYGFLSAFGQAPKQKLDFSVSIKSLEAAKPGVEGWSYAGKFINGAWAGKYFDFPKKRLPNANRAKVYNVEYPLNLRQKGTKEAAVIGQLRLNQKVKILDVASKDQENYWVKVKVIQ